MSRMGSGLSFSWTARTELAGREANEDRLYASPRVVAVADGVGGAVAGEVASELAINALAALDKRFVDGPVEAGLATVFDDGNERIRFVSSCRPHLTGMATTLAVTAIDDAGAYVVASIGDSRTYLYRDHELQRLTRDDTLVQHLVDEGHLDPAEARTHPQRSVVTAVLDGQPGRQPSTSTLGAQKGDRVLTCSDGLTDMVDDDILKHALRLPREKCAATLVDAALEAGGTDNISMVIADVGKQRRARDRWQPSS
jgi:PPM family protein phosphatase